MNEEQIEININETDEIPEETITQLKEYNEEEVFDKKPKKKKRTLTERQQKALAEGRAKIKAKRLAKQEEEMKKKLEAEAKDTKKEEKVLIEKAENEKQEQKRTRKAKLTAQEKAKARIKEKTNKRKSEEDKLVDEFEELKYKCLESCDTEEEFDKLDSVLSSYIKRSDILKGKEHLRNKVGEIVKLVKKE
jgi:membrane protein involved in colicin uptake